MCKQVIDGRRKMAFNDEMTAFDDGKQAQHIQHILYHAHID